MARRFDGIVLFGRAVVGVEPADYILSEDVRLVALPHYSDLKQLRDVIRAFPGTARAMWSGLDGVDALWVFGPHPFEFLLMFLALVRRKRVVVGVRQDTLTYTRMRLGTGRGQRVKFAASAIMDGIHRLLGRRLPATLVGPEIAAHYGGERPSNLVMTVSLVPELALAAGPRDGQSATPARLLTIGRLDNEKNPLLVVQTLAELERRRPGGQRLTWIGRGTMEAEVHTLAAELGVEDLIDFRGYLSFGEELLDLYRGADAFVHVSWTEGVPQVLVEAMACATPIVATAVGGVAGLLDGGTAGLLVAAGDRDAPWMRSSACSTTDTCASDSRRAACSSPPS
ncbi:hypothetical protein BH20ACT16_BH20ACT16_06840 [soil metagenome]